MHATPQPVLIPTFSADVDALVVDDTLRVGLRFEHFEVHFTLRSTARRITNFGLIDIFVFVFCLRASLGEIYTHRHTRVRADRRRLL